MVQSKPRLRVCDLKIVAQCATYNLAKNIRVQLFKTDQNISQNTCIWNLQPKQVLPSIEPTNTCFVFFFFHCGDVEKVEGVNTYVT